MFYSIYRNGSFIGEKKLSIIENSNTIEVKMKINVGESNRQINVLLSNDNMIKRFNVFVDGKKIYYNAGKDSRLYTNSLFCIDEVLITCFEKLMCHQKELVVFSSENFDFYKIKFFEKGNRKYNILVPSYAYLEYDDDGLLGYYEDFKEGLQVIRGDL